jgi:hypothetical protein
VGKVEVERRILTPEEMVKWFDGMTLEMNKGIFKVIFSYRAGGRRYELKIYRENVCLFHAEGATWETPIRMLEGHISFLKLVAETLRMLKPFAVFEKVGKQKEEEEQEEEHEE